MRDAKLVLGDGSVFYGESFGSDKSVAGEVVFNTGMVGYPESFTDPSYKGQILTLTYPLVGNYGVPSYEKEGDFPKYFESEKIHIAGLIVSEYSKNYSHWNAKKSLSEWLREFDVPAIQGIDTRMLTKKLREHGVILGKIVIGEDIEFQDPNRYNLASQVSVKGPVTYGLGKKKLLVIDCGIKLSIIKNLLKRNVTIIRVPWNHDFSGLDFDGLVISNGPGNPKSCKETINNVREALKKEIPTFGICFGNQILALATGADTYKLKYGHRSQNQPCLEVGTKRCYITSQNHGYAVDTKTLPTGWEEWFRNVNDGTNEGIRHKTKPFMSVQFHPEATPGPVDTGFLFDEFLKELK